VSLRKNNGRKYHQAVHNVKDMHTSFSLGEVKAGGALPLKHLVSNAS
jgi:hypothetical protein